MNFSICFKYIFKYLCISPPGVLAPVYGVGLLLTDSIQDPTDRLVACEVIHICAVSIAAFHMTVLLSGLIFRWVLIRFSDRGLVIKGRPELRLFNQLYWVTFGTCCCLGISIFTIVPFVRGNFEDSIRGRKCMLQPTETTTIGVNRVMIRIATALIAAAYALMLRFKVSRYFSGVCPKGHMSAIGRYNRNMIGFNKNCWLFFAWFMFALYMAVGDALPIIFTNMSPKVSFWIYNGVRLAFIWLYIGLVLPLSMKIPWKVQTKKKSSPFYVREPEFPNMHYFPHYCPAAQPPSPLLNQVLHSPSIWTKNTDSINSTIQTPTVLNTPAITLSPDSLDRETFPSTRKILVEPAKHMDSKHDGDNQCYMSESILPSAETLKTHEDMHTDDEMFAALQRICDNATGN